MAGPLLLDNKPSLVILTIQLLTFWARNFKLTLQKENSLQTHVLCCCVFRVEAATTLGPTPRRTSLHSAGHYSLRWEMYRRLLGQCVSQIFHYCSNGGTDGGKKTCQSDVGNQRDIERRYP